MDRSGGAGGLGLSWCLPPALLNRTLKKQNGVALEGDSPVKRPARKVTRVLGSEGEEEEDALTPPGVQVVCPGICCSPHELGLTLRGVGGLDWLVWVPGQSSPSTLCALQKSWVPSCTHSSRDIPGLQEGFFIQERRK